MKKECAQTRMGLNRTASLILYAVLFTALAVSVPADLVQEDFNSYTLGDLDGQDGWSSGLPGPVQVISGTGINTSRVVSNTDEATTGYAQKDVVLDWSGLTQASLSVDFNRIGTSSIDSWAGVQDSSLFRGYGVRVRTADIGFREGASGGDAWLHTDVDGNTINVQNEKWYRITYEFTLGATPMITKATLYNLTDGGSSQLYFGADTPTLTPSAATNPANWDQVRVRVPGSHQGVLMYDNISLIPEPASLGMLLIGALGVFLLRRSRGARAYRLEFLEARGR
ncbi:MAG: PEP-CTERM sorting domain-containing protein [Candidatus Marinimicrobia bacterium]|nr:PEP-CTERM sorting domain-containing protein [Candidatus Neomarinimicrobiota bacterium]